MEEDTVRKVRVRDSQGTGHSVSFEERRTHGILLKGISSTGYSAFLDVLRRRQTGYSEVITWLREETTRLVTAR